MTGTRVLKSPNCPNEGSDAHLKQINPEAKVFYTMDFSHGYYQVPIREKDRNLFAFLVPQGKYRFCRLPQGSRPAFDLFNIITDPEIRSIPEIQKNMDDLLLSEKNYKLLDPLIDRILSICREKNLKLKPSKFKIGLQVEFGGKVIKYSQTNKRVQITPSEQKVEELMDKEAPKT